MMCFQHRRGVVVWGVYVLSEIGRVYVRGKGGGLCPIFNQPDPKSKLNQKATEALEAQ